MENQDNLRVSKRIGGSAPTTSPGASRLGAFPSGIAKRASIRARFAALARALHQWLRVNTLAPEWQPRRWRRPIFSYVLAALAQLAAIFAVVVIIVVFPTFQFPEALPLLANVFIALSWGAGPGVVAVCLSAVLLDYLILPPHLSFSLYRVEDVAGIWLFLLVGVIISVVAGQTERTRTALAAERAEQDATIEAMADGMVVYDATGAIVRMNAAARAIFARAVPTDYVERPIRDRTEFLALRGTDGKPIAPDDWPGPRVLRGETLTGRHVLDVTYGTSDGATVWLSISGAPVRAATGEILGGMTIYRDITWRHELERRTHNALNALLRMAESLVEPEKAPASTAEMLVEEAGSPARGDRAGEIVASRVSQRLALLSCDVLGCSRVGILVLEPETQVLRPVAVVGLSPEQERQWWAEQQQHEVHLGEGVEPEVIARFLGGEPVMLDLTQPPYDALPNPYGITTSLFTPMRLGDALVGVLSLDFGGQPHVFTPEEKALSTAVAKLAALVIERERLLSERAEADARELALSQTNARMHRFIGIAGHELRTPVTSIKVNIQLAERRLRESLQRELPQDVHDYVARAREVTQRAEEQIERLNRLIGDLLDVSRIESGKLQMHPTTTDVTVVVRDVIEAQRAVLPSRDISLAIAPDVPAALFVDPDRISQVVTNYLTNAIKYSPQDRPIEVSITTAGDALRVAVRDYGPGIPEDARARIWEPFHQLDNQYEPGAREVGLGLGLHICRTIIEQHGGRVDVESQVGEGATFWFELPAADRRPATEPR